jgi:hypothetical protein
MAISDTKNPFVEKLLSLQQDGSQAISAPSNWTRTTPLLEVETELDVVIDAITNECLEGDSNRNAIWYFFIGSPGNGKSAAVGGVVRNLINNKKCRICDENNVDISKLDETSVPYYLNVYEVGKPYCTVRIVQDASVVRNPYDSDVDPSRDLLKTLEAAWADGISLIVCTNRGVLEKAYRETYRSQEYAGKAWHQSILKQLTERYGQIGLNHEPISFDKPKRNFTKVIAKATFLDQRSLILNNSNILGRIIDKAIDISNWSVCEECSAKNLCPFKQNQFSLSDSKLKQNLITLLRRAEIVSSQVIVFREALAAISFILAGSARDYVNIHPCDWVRLLQSRRDYFALGSRRIHMCLFNSTAPRCLDIVNSIRVEQIKSLKNLYDYAYNLNQDKAKQIKALEDDSPSTDVGVKRLFGLDGVLMKIDPLNGTLDPNFVDRWDNNFTRILNDESESYVTKLDRACIASWSFYEDCSESYDSHESEEIFLSLKRWSSHYLLHLGVFVEGMAANSKEIDEFSHLIELLSKREDDRTNEDNLKIDKLENDISKLLNRNNGSKDGVSFITIADGVEVYGEYFDNELKPKIKPSGSSGSLSVTIEFGTKEKTNLNYTNPNYTNLNYSAYLWLCERGEAHLNINCVSSDLMSDAMDAKSRAASRSKYSWVSDKVNLKIEALVSPDDKLKHYIIGRLKGKVNVRCE